MTKVRALFNFIMEDYAVTAKRLSATDFIVQDPTFKSCISKVQSEKIPLHFHMKSFIVRKRLKFQTAKVLLS